MLGVTEILSAAKRELGDRLLQKRIDLCCPSCGLFVGAILVIPNLVRNRCSKCRVDVISLVSDKREVLAVTERHQ